MEPWDEIKNENGLRVIKTARDEASINKAVKLGCKALIKKLVPSVQIRSKYAVVQNKKTGEIEVYGDFRMGLPDKNNKDYKTVIDWTFYYPHCFASPFAAYLIPKDVKVGERVFVEDLIEDYVGSTWNQGDTYRLKSCEAIWNGSYLEIQYNERKHNTHFMG